MVSRKCTCQLSSGYTLPIEAAMPPSAITVCALPSRDLQTTATRAPASWAAIAARSPAPPAPITTTSYWWRSKPCQELVAAVPASIRLPVIGWRLRSAESIIGNPFRGSRAVVSGRGEAGQRSSSVGSEDPRVGERADGQQVHVEVRDRHREQGEPGVASVLGVQPGHERP